MDSIINSEYYLCGYIETWSPTWKHRPRKYMKRSEIFYVTNGVLHIDEEGQEFSCKKGEVLLLERHKGNFGNKPSGVYTSFYWILFEGDLPSWIQKHFPLINAQYIENMMKQLVFVENIADYPRYAKDYFVRLILIELLRQNKLCAEGISPLVESIKNYVLANNNRNISVSELAGKFGYSSDYLSKLFAKEMHLSLHDFIRDSRLSYIKELLSSKEHTLKEVAMLTGFSEPSYFFKYFKYHEKMTPTEFIKRFNE
ncbi:MAG: helix-turn-helix transcriptional regulator [Clostridiales bacterium]|nr:helix-turn-helix transcriptional regulator [Clostridiales bacterium]